MQLNGGRVCEASGDRRSGTCHLCYPESACTLAGEAEEVEESCEKQYCDKK